MMAAGKAVERGRSVLLLEKNSALGRKLLVTGGTRCNLTNNIPYIRQMLANYKDSGRFLFSAFSQFGAEDTISFFNGLGVATKEEPEGRIFPVSDSAQSVLDALIRYMKKGNVEIVMNANVSELTIGEKKKHINIRIKDGKEIKARSCIVATGGTALPSTGSTGDGFEWLKKLGHTIYENYPALVPIALKDTWVKKISGVTLENIKLTVFQNDRKQSVHKGNLLFTHFGVSGPLALNMSREIGELIKHGSVTMDLDIFPAIDHGALKNKLQELFKIEGNKKVKNILSALIPAAFVPEVLGFAGIDGEIEANSMRSEDRTKLVAMIKNIPLNVKSLLGADHAISSSGGVEPREVDFKTMESRVVPHLYIIGDALDIDRPSGGFSLQVCWTTGFVAGSNC